jgi:hypothetical protein
VDFLETSLQAKTPSPGVIARNERSLLRKSEIRTQPITKHTTMTLSKNLALAALLLVSYNVEAFVSPQQPRTTTCSSTSLAGYGIGSWNKKSSPPSSGGAGSAGSTRNPWDDANAAKKVEASDAFTKAASSPPKSSGVKKSYGLGSWSKSTWTEGAGSTVAGSTSGGGAAAASTTSSRNPWDDVNADKKVSKASDAFAKAPKAAAKKKSYGLGSWSK